MIAAAALFAAHASAQFNLYPPIDPTRLAAAFNISSGCLSALNTTVTCDQTLLTMAGTVDNYLWDIDNVTALCTQPCLASAQSWYESVDSSCANDVLTFAGKQVPAVTVPGRTLDGLNIACLTPTTNVSLDAGVAASIVTVYNTTDNSTTASEKRDSSSSGYCLIDSYNWVGSDIIRPDCTQPGMATNQQCIDPTNVTDYNQRLSNLYPNSLLCSTCFVNMFFLRVSSPYLPDLDYSDYLVEQYYDIIEVCGISAMPQLVVRLTPDYDDAPGYFDGQPVNNTIQPFVGGVSGIPPNATAANGTCAGQTLTFNQIAKVANGINPSVTFFCDALSVAFNVTSGDLYQAFGNYGCDTLSPNATSATWCLPQGCTIYEVPANASCAQVAAQVSTAQNNITVQQLVQYNPNLDGTCDAISPQYVCITPPGGAYIPPPVNASSTNAGQQQRGGGDGSSTGNQTTVGTGNPAVTIKAGGAAPSPTQSGIVAGCLVFSNASAGDGCYSFSQEHNITSNNLYAWNGVLGAAGAYCATEFWAGYWYCIGTNTSQPTPTSTPTPVSSGQPAPTPTQSGIVSSCDKYAKANSGDTCASFATNQGIGTAQLFTWNTQLGATGQNCSNEFWAGYYYCVHAPTAATSTSAPTHTASPAPSPTQSGIVANCNKYYLAKSGDGCYSFAQENAITTNQLYAWNTQLGASGQNCGTQFWAGYYYCVGVSGGSKRRSRRRSVDELAVEALLGDDDSRATSLNPRLRSVPLAERDLPTGTCNAATPCVNGACCGSDNLCGYSPKSCGTGCQHNCNAKAQCGPYAAAGQQKCPLNVCCSEFGFCGSTTEFCTWTNPTDPNYSKCNPQYGSCGAVNRPSCGSGGNSVSKRNIGYYESWANTRACQKVAPEDLNLDGFTSINFAFSFFDPTTFTITPMDANGASLYSRFTALKQKKPGLEAYISVGGWSFTDPGSTQDAFSNMASSAGNRAAFINGLVKFMDTYGFDGVDIDWEYPGADDRGGVAADTANYVALTKDMRAAFGSKYGLTVTIPTSFWYLQHFDLVGIQSNIDWFNLMAYDLHGTWDAQSKFVGPYIAPHTNLTEIDLALDLLWRAGVDSSKVVLGQGWYGRSFTLKDPSCSTPNGVCQFTGGAAAGPCSQASGILDYQEIANVITQYKLTPTWDHTAGVKWIHWNSNQWVSYDDGDTFKQKRDLANERCLGGLMVWAMDQVDQTANNGFGGAAAAAGANVSPSQQASADQQTADNLASMKCYVSDCNAGCKAGTTEVAEFNGQPGQISTNGRCAKKTYRSLCCDSKTEMGTCQWRGYRGAGLACIKGCASGETELTTNTDQHDAKKGDKDCHGGLQSFCCAGFKPSSSSLEDDLKDAAKAAAEAAAEQAALDLAAKAFCRVAVPALLAPLELLEDLIPIVGEIADAVEIAATPAIIEGCVKGIEKEGKAEFKVFGKEHTLAMDSPKTKPTDVPDRPPAKGDNPSKTGDKDDQCEAKSKVKRALPPVQTEYNDLPRMKRLVTSSGRPRDYEWKDGEGYALRIMWPRRYTLNQIPAHYALVAGYVSLGKPSNIQNTKDQCGKVIRRTRTVTRDWHSNGYELAVINDKMTQTTPVGADGELIPFDDVEGMEWVGSNFDKAYLVWQNMGPIRPGVEYEEAFDRGTAYIAKYNNYNVLFNNCYHFANALYDWMVNAAAPLRRRDDLCDECSEEEFVQLMKRAAIDA